MIPRAGRAGPNVLRLPTRRRSRGRTRGEGEGTLVRLPAALPRTLEAPAPAPPSPAPEINDAAYWRGELAASLSARDLGLICATVGAALTALPKPARYRVGRLVLRLLDRVIEGPVGSPGSRVVPLRPGTDGDGGAP